MKHVYVISYNDKISSEGYDTFEKAVALIQGRSDIATFRAETPFHYTNGKDSYKIHDVVVKQEWHKLLGGGDYDKDCIGY